MVKETMTSNPPQNRAKLEPSILSVSYSQEKSAACPLDSSSREKIAGPSMQNAALDPIARAGEAACCGVMTDGTQPHWSGGKLT
jgi:hypothetical protein